MKSAMISVTVLHELGIRQGNPI